MTDERPTPAPHPTPPPAPARPPARNWFLGGNWTLVSFGTGHLAYMTAVVVRGPAAAEQATLDTMNHTASGDLLGLPRNLLGLFYGFSVTMALFAIALGAVSLVAVRLAPEVLTRGTGLVWLDLAACTVALAVAVAAFPAPAVVLLLVASTAFTVALVRASNDRAVGYPSS